MMKNSWKMRCVDDGGYSSTYKEGKVYEVKNGMVSFDDGFTYGGYKSFKHWKSFDGGKWELVEDETLIKEKIAKAEAKVKKWQEMLDVLKQQEQEEKEKKPLTGWEVPEEDDAFWVITRSSSVLQDVNHPNNSMGADGISVLNAFSTKEKAQEIANAQLAYRMARKFADEWEGESDGKLWEINYSIYRKMLSIVSTESFPSMANIFTSECCVKAFIDQHGKEYAKLLGWELEG